MSNAFYLVDEKHGKADGGVVSVTDVLYFKHKTAGFDGRATKEHVREYGSAYSAFKATNPGFKLPWGEDADLIGKKAPVVGEVFSTPIAERPVAEVAAEPEVKHKKKLLE